MGFARFMATGFGRGLRVVLGLALMYWGFRMVTGTSGLIIAAVGLVLLLTGTFNICLLAPVLGVPFSGKKLSEMP